MPSKRKLADAAFLRQQALLNGRVPVPEGTLPGQIDMLDGSVAGIAPTAEPVAQPTYPELSAIPDHCTQCNKLMTIDSGWTPMKPEEARRIQCGDCGLVIVVPQGSYNTLGLALRNRFHNVDRYVQPLARVKKQRGAG